MKNDLNEELLQRRSQKVAEDLVDYIQVELAKMIGGEQFATIIQTIVYANISIMLIAAHIKIMKMSNPNPRLPEEFMVRATLNEIIEKALKMADTVSMHKYNEVSDKQQGK